MHSVVASTPPKTAPTWPPGRFAPMTAAATSATPPHTLNRLLRHMPQVQSRRQELRLVESAWDNLAVLASLSRLSSGASSGGDLSRARQDFAALSEEMMRGLQTESLRNALEGLGSKAQVCIDILVRNLFERTADIGFLATDSVIAQFLGQPGSVASGQMEARLREYAAKYSVYGDICLFDTQGHLQASLVPRGGPVALQGSDLDFLKQVLASTSPYLEHYGVHHFCANPPDSGHAQVGALGTAATLLYAHCVEHAAAQVGALCLQFRLADEMPAIFGAIQGDGAHGEGDGTTLALVDEAGRVIASSDALQLPAGWVLPLAREAGDATLRHLGREYLMVVRDTHGFQGYMGPRWRALAMIPIDMAFDVADTSGASALMLEAAHSNGLLAAELRDIPHDAAHIQSALERSVWNGLLDINRIATDGSAAQAREMVFARTLLSEIGNTAHKTAQAFSSTLQDLHFVVIRAMLRDAQDRAALAMQILDRNLYERANDCRWWALTPQFGHTLRAGTLGCDQATQVLQYINSLYTVYASLVLFDRHGTVVATSRPELAQHVGQPITDAWVQPALRLQASKDYAVSAFAPSQFSDGVPTFVYAAAVFDDGHPGAGGTPGVLGGIGIVWDAANQLSSILADCGAGCSPDDLLAFVDNAGNVLFSHGQAGLLDSPQAVATARRGNDIVELGGDGRPGRGSLLGTGTHRGQGYREFRAQDGYDHGLACVVLRSLCQPGSRAAPGAQATRPSAQAGQVDAEFSLQMATFNVGGYWLGLPAAQVLLAAPDATIVSAGRPTPPFSGFVPIGAEKTYPAIDLRSATSATPGSTPDADGARQLILVRVTQDTAAGGRSHDIALRVDALGSVLEVDSRKLQKLDLMGSGGMGNSVSMVDAVVSVPTGATGSAPGSASGQTVLCRLSMRWLQHCASGLARDFVPQDLSALASA